MFASLSRLCIFHCQTFIILVSLAQNSSSKYFYFVLNRTFCWHVNGKSILTARKSMQYMENDEWPE